MPLSPEQLSQIINRSKNIIDNDRIVENKSKSVRGKVNIPREDIDPNSYSDEWDNFSLATSQVNEQYATQEAMQPLSYTDDAVMNSRFPDAIKKSLMEQRITVPQTQETININNMTKMALQQRQGGQQMMAETTSQPMPQVNNNSGIDYNYLKYIISDCIKEYFQNNPIDAGGNLKQITLNKGVIKLIDSKGNIFSAQLEHKGNIADKKK